METQRHCCNPALSVYLPVKRSISYKPETLVNMRGWGAYSSLQEEEEENTVELLQGLSIVSLLHTVHSELYIHTSVSVHSRELWSSRVQLLTTLEASSPHSLPTDPSGHSPPPHSLGATAYLSALSLSASCVARYLSSSLRVAAARKGLSA